MRRTLFLASALLLGAASASAHDFWIAPSTFRPAVGERVAVELLVGEHFAGESLVRNPERIERFFALPLGAGASGEVDLLGVDGRAPAGYWRADRAGLAWLGYRSRPSSIELPAVKFEAYLAEEGLQRIIELRKQRGESLLPGRERYSRCAKALLQTAGADSTACADGAGDFERSLSFPLELVLQANPYALRTGDELVVQLLFDGRPLEGALVGCMNRVEPESEQRLRTDAEGRVRFPLVGSGAFLLRVVHMVPAPAESGADWESYWASLTFELAGASEPARERS